MAIFKHILLATDFGESSNQALRVATELASQFEAKLTLVHIWEFPRYGYTESLPVPVDYLDEISNGAEACMAETVASIKEQCPNARSVVKMGNIGDEVLKTVEEERPDLLVVGTHGRRGLKRAVLGSVAEKLVRTSPVPVLTVHGKAPEH